MSLPNVQTSGGALKGAAASERPLTRPAPAEENAGTVRPLPQGGEKV